MHTGQSFSVPAATSDQTVLGIYVNRWRRCGTAIMLAHAVVTFSAIKVRGDDPRRGTRTLNVRIAPHWIDSNRLEFLRETSSGVVQTVRVDAATGEMRIVAAGGTSNERPSTVDFKGGSTPRSTPSQDASNIRVINETPEAIELLWVDQRGRRHRYRRIEPGESYRQSTYAGHVWEAVDDHGVFYGSVIAGHSEMTAVIRKTFERPPRISAGPDSSDVNPDDNSLHLRVRISGNDLQLRPSESSDWETIDRITDADSKETSWHRPSLSADGQVLAVWKRTPGDDRPVYTIESSPERGGRAVLNQQPYRLPGDRMDHFELVVFETQSRSRIDIDLPLIDFGRPRIRWRAGHELLIEKVDRGHQRFRLFAIDPLTQSIRTPIDEQTDTFIWTVHGPPVKPVTYLESNDHVIHASEQSGYRHLRWIDLSGELPQRSITQGDFLVREIIHIDEESGLIDLVVGELDDDQDPYHRHLIRVSMDDGSITRLTTGDGDHEYAFSPDRRYVVVNHSRVDSPPVHELRRCDDGSLIATLCKATRVSAAQDLPPLPTRFHAKGRDGLTDIWGFICFPDDAHLVGATKYPVIEWIYAGPHDAHVPKRYRSSPWMTEWTELGFIVVRIDGMGTANRSKAFHDVCWHNLKDAGFPDRIAWMKAAAKRYPSMDLERVGIFGTSAGGQNACGALLFHGDFYKAAVASCGCHDNRMDKASWNEQWMGTPVGPHYSDSSNIDHAANLEGHLMLILGELDTNVPPESTLRLVDALIDADKDFDFLMIPGMGHSDGGPYGRRRMRDFFSRHLQPKPHPSDAPTSKPKAVTAEQLESTKPIPAWQRNAALYRADRDRLLRQFPIRIMPERLTQWQRFDDRWRIAIETGRATHPPIAELEAIDELVAQLDEDRQQLRADAGLGAAFRQTHPFTEELMQLIDLRQRGRPLNAPRLAKQLAALEQELPAPNETNEVSEGQGGNDEPQLKVAEELATQFAAWRRFHADYNPEFDWWVGDSAKQIESRLKAWRPDPIASASVDTAPDPDAETMLDANYPQSVIETPPSITVMPAIMERFMSDLRSLKSGDEADETTTSVNQANDRSKFLLDWSEAVRKLRLDDRPFSDWCRSDQVDYHRLRNDIAYRLEVIQDEQTPKPISKSAADHGIEGTVAGRPRLMLELRREQIHHTPEQLIELAEQEYEVCREDMIATANEMGFGDDWQAAVEHIKTLHVPAGKQPELIHSTAADSVAWLRQRDLLTIDRLAETSWRMQMMTPQRQRVNPFFTGGEVISVSFPTRQMSGDEKRQSLRGNNQPFARATVHHELIPGHHLQLFQTSRHQTHRRQFGTPFWLEGWAVYWEFVLENNGFARTPEERMGFLVWRAHRYARILFSLRFHLGQLAPDQCVDFLVANVGFDRRNAEAEVRRSVGPDYPPLYQAAYMLGAMQLRQLAARWSKEQLGSPKEFHDAVMRSGPMPIASLRALLWDESLTRDQAPSWQFAELTSKSDKSDEP
ncbi:MAG: DUF885 family protein [Planctomycetota bacterium]